MASTLLMKGLVFTYVIVSLVSALEGNWPRAMYWIGAGIITSAVLWSTN